MVPIALIAAARYQAAEPTRTELIETHAPMARSMARRYRNRGVEIEDLEQVALLGLTKAAQRFNPDAGHAFTTFAVPTVRGELRKYFRDSGWMVRPPRRVQELQPRIRFAEQTLTAKLGHSPRPTELADHLDCAVDDVIEALATQGCFAPTSLDAPVAEGSHALSDLLGTDDVEMSRSEARVMLGPVLRRLPEQDRHILRLRFYQERTQREIAEVVGVTQAQVSRTLLRILRTLRTQLETASAA